MSCCHSPDSNKQLGAFRNWHEAPNCKLENSQPDFPIKALAAQRKNGCYLPAQQDKRRGAQEGNALYQNPEIMAYFQAPKTGRAHIMHQRILSPELRPLHVAVAQDDVAQLNSLLASRKKTALDVDEKDEVIPSLISLFAE